MNIFKIVSMNKIYIHFPWKWHFFHSPQSFKLTACIELCCKIHCYFYLNFALVLLEMEDGLSCQLSVEWKIYEQWMVQIRNTTTSTITNFLRSSQKRNLELSNFFSNFLSSNLKLRCSKIYLIFDIIEFSEL